MALYSRSFEAPGRKGQVMSGISLFYSIVLLFLGLLVIGAILIFVDDFLGVKIYHYAVESGVDATTLSHMETLRSLLPILALLGMIVGVIISSYIYGG